MKAPSVAAVLVASGVATSLAACQQILGLEEPTLRDEDAGCVAAADGVGVFDPKALTFHLRDACGKEVTFDLRADGIDYPDDLLPIAGDWTGSGTDTVGVFSQKSSRFWLRSANASGASILASLQMGVDAGEFPVAGDWGTPPRTPIADGIDTVGFYAPETSAFFLENDGGNLADLQFFFGGPDPAYRPMAGNWKGDAISNVGLYDSDAGGVFFDDSFDSGPAFLQYDVGDIQPGWLPVAGDWDGRGVDSFALYDPVTSTFHFAESIMASSTKRALKFGTAGAGLWPVAGHWKL